MHNQNTEQNEQDLQIEVLDQLINNISIKEYELKSAMLAEDDALIEKLDSEISTLNTKILDYYCSNNAERKMLFTYLSDRYLCNEEVSSFIPSGVVEKMKSLF